jgi:hypothetical protein
MKAMLPTQPLALRICDIFHRRHTTPWQPKEVRAYKAIARYVVEEDLQMIERTYREQWPPNRDKNILRHDLFTFLNNYSGEVDRARIWCELHPIKSQTRKVIPMPPIQSVPYVAPSDPADLAAIERFNAERLLRKQAKAT